MAYKQAKPSLCQQAGHYWTSGPIEHYRLCRRKACRAAQHFNGSEWVYVARRAPSSTKRQPNSAQQAITQPSLIDTRTLTVYDKEAERRAEQTYYRLLGR